MSQTPGFRKMWEAAQTERERRVVRRRWVRASGASVAVALVSLLLYRSGPEQSDASVEDLIAFSQELESWQGPLASLLETPGYENLATSPSFGAPLDEWETPWLSEERTPS